MAVVLSVSAAEEAAEPTEPEPVPAEGAAAEEAVPEEPEIVLNCNANGATCRATGQGTTRLRHCLHLRYCLHLHHCLHCLHLRHFRPPPPPLGLSPPPPPPQPPPQPPPPAAAFAAGSRHPPVTGPLARWQSCSTRSRRGASTAWPSGSRTLASVRSPAPPQRPTAPATAQGHISAQDPTSAPHISAPHQRPTSAARASVRTSAPPHQPQPRVPGLPCAAPAPHRTGHSPNPNPAHPARKPSCEGCTPGPGPWAVVRGVVAPLTLTLSSAPPHQPPQPRVQGPACTPRSARTHAPNGGMPSAPSTQHRLHPCAYAADLKTPFMGNKVDGAALAKDLRSPPPG